MRKGKVNWRGKMHNKFVTDAHIARDKGPTTVATLFSFQMLYHQRRWEDDHEQ
jgi:hypothetical protein